MQKDNREIRHDEGDFRACRDTRLFWQSWTATDHPVGALILIHGFGEHSGRYSYLVDQLCAAKIKVFAFDLRGHGRSDGRRGHINSITDYRGDISAFMAQLDSRIPDIPKFIFGHSMGSLLVLDYVLRRPQGLAGTVISGAGLEPAGVATAPVVFLARMLSVIWPVFPLTLAVDSALLTRDKTEIENYNNDPLVHQTSTTRMANELLHTIDWIKDHPQNLQLPILMVHGEADSINLPSGSRSFISNVTFPDKTLLIYPDGFHELHNDLDREKVLSDFCSWLLDRV